MRNALCTIALTLAAVFCTADILVAQRTVVWKGGTPGQETNWNCAKNWSGNNVPNLFSDVLIPDVSTTTFSAPVIQSGAFEVNSLQLESNAHLTIEANAKLVVILADKGFGNTDGLKVKGLLLTPASNDNEIAKR